ncbi:hypothetical protein GGF46_000351 [Coemansia sp. RSA 552]|nr:hypothetical protein GGF46_000351 [Coemansia sp. RSA 552]
MSRSVISLTVPETQQAQLVRDGFRTLSDLSVCTAPPSLVRPQPPVLNSAWTLVQRQRTHPHFTTGISTLDALLGNSGLPLGAVLEVVADPVGAAAELCLRLSVGVQLNWPSGEDGVSVVYIDTTGSFSQGAAQRVARKVCGGRVVDPATLLDRIHVFRVYTADELVALLDSADEVFGHLDKRYGIYVGGNSY